MSLLSRLDPRLHLAAAIGWAVFGIVALAALLAADYAAVEAGRRARADAERLLMQFTVQSRDALTSSLRTRRAIIQVTASQIAASGDQGRAALQRHLQAVQAEFPEFVWLGVANAQGRMVASTAHRAGAPLLAFAVAIEPAAGKPGGALGAALSRDWVRRLQAVLLKSLDTRRSLQILLIAKDGTVLIGPDKWRGRPHADTGDLSENGAYLVSRRAIENGPTPAWTVVLRQTADTALAPVHSTRQTVFFGVLLAGLAAAVAAVLMTRMLTRRLAQLADKALAIQRGERRTLIAPAGRDEVSRIGATLAGTIDQLQQEKQALLTLNAELDARVIERSARIERLADEARQAALTRDRLRLARDLHDTLAHSLMALLTQIRLVRKLHVRLAAEELDAELERAENVAASGLSEARAAILQIRYNGVRDIGLGAAVRELLKRFAERTGIDAQFRAEARATEIDGERGETVYRIVEEALRNVERHARATQVEVTVSWQGEGASAARWRVEVADNGVGFDPSATHPGHYGLRGIQEQAALIGAQLGVHSRGGDGARIVLAFDA